MRLSWHEPEVDDLDELDTSETYLLNTLKRQPKTGSAVIKRKIEAALEEAYPTPRKNAAAARKKYDRLHTSFSLYKAFCTKRSILPYPLTTLKAALFLRTILDLMTRAQENQQPQQSELEMHMQQLMTIRRIHAPFFPDQAKELQKALAEEPLVKVSYPHLTDSSVELISRSGNHGSA